MESVVKDVLVLYGPLAIGWLVALGLGWMMIIDRRKPDGALTAYQRISEAYHEAIVENTAAMQKLATILEERTRR